MGSDNRLSVPGRYEQIRVLCDFVSLAAIEVGFDDDAAFRLELACDEACTNVIEHAYGAEDQGPISVEWWVEGDRFVIAIHDEGQAFNPSAVGEPDLPAGPEELDKLKVGGLGVHIMRRVMDEIRYRSDGDQGNTLIMIKRLSGADEP